MDWILFGQFITDRTVSKPTQYLIRHCEERSDVAISNVALLYFHRKAVPFLSEDGFIRIGFF